MRDEVPARLAAAQLDALVVIGPGQHNPAMVYLLGRPTALTDAVLIYPREGEALLLHSPMERDAAAQTGLPTRGFERYPFARYLKQHNGDRFRARVARWRDILTDAGLARSRFAVVGRVEFSHGWSLWQALARELPDAQIFGREGWNALAAARIRKGPEEVEAIRRVGRATVAIVDRTRAWLRQLYAADDGRVVDAQGQTVTIGHVKQRIRRWLAEADLEIPHGFIFAQGRDAGVPHNPGDPEQPLYVGQTIVFDIFPQEAGGGYFYDFTRTWVLGRATEEQKRLHHHVCVAFERSLARVRAGEAWEAPYLAAAEYFESHGHPTLRTRSNTQTGFVHSLGHGLGLEIHEDPRLMAGATQPLEPGMVVTVEPGLYYPDQGLGFRLEDTVWIREDGHAEILVPYPYDLEIPLANLGPTTA